MDFVIDNRNVRVLFTKTVLNREIHGEIIYENEITDEEIHGLSRDYGWWESFVPNYLRQRNLELSNEWYQYQQNMHNGRSIPDNDLLVQYYTIGDLNTRMRMSDFPNFFGRIRIYAIFTLIPLDGTVSITFHLHKDAL